MGTSKLLPKIFKLEYVTTNLVAGWTSSAAGLLSCFDKYKSLYKRNMIANIAEIRKGTDGHQI